MFGTFGFVLALFVIITVIGLCFENFLEPQIRKLRKLIK